MDSTFINGVTLVTLFVHTVRIRHRWEDSIKTDLTETGHKDADWIHLAQDSVQWQAYVRAVMNSQVPQKVGNFLIISFIHGII